MMCIEKQQAYELVTTSTMASLAKQDLMLLDQPPHTQVRGLVRLCQQMSQQYQQSPETCLERSWWRLFNQAGCQLRDALDQTKTENYQGLSDQEAEQAYFLLIHVAYFFEPGGVAQTLWPLLPPEQGDQPARPPTNEALGVAFPTLPPASPGVRMRQQVRRCFQHLGQLLGRANAHDRERAELLARNTQRLPPLEEATSPSPLATRRPSDGSHPGR